MNAPVAVSARVSAREAKQTRAAPAARAAVGLDILEALRSALGALAANKLRAVLTGLGIFIGVAAVIATVSVGAGARQQVKLWKTKPRRRLRMPASRSGGRRDTSSPISR